MEIGIGEVLWEPGGGGGGGRGWSFPTPPLFLFLFQNSALETQALNSNNGSLNRAFLSAQEVLHLPFLILPGQTFLLQNGA